MSVNVVIVSTINSTIVLHVTRIFVIRFASFLYKTDENKIEQNNHILCICTTPIASMKLHTQASSTEIYGPIFPKQIDSLWLNMLYYLL